MLEERLHRRRGHPVGPSLLASQLEALEEPTDAVSVDATGEPEAVLCAILRELPDVV